MKKVFIAGILALVVIGCVLAAGCTTTTSNLNQASGTMTDIATGTTTEESTDAATTAPQQVTFTISYYDYYKNWGRSPTTQQITADVGSKLKFANAGCTSGIFYGEPQDTRSVFKGDLIYVVNDQTETKQITSLVSGNKNASAYAIWKATGAGDNLYTDSARTNKFVANNSEIEVTADMDGKTFYY